MSRVERRLARALSIADLRAIARSRLPRSVFEFIDGGAEDELTLRDNREALERRRIVPRVLVDVANPDLRTDLFGHTSAAPFVVAPMGSCALAWPEADLAIARAAAACGIPYTLSTMSTVGIERMAAAMATARGRLWFQLYVLRDEALCRSLVQRAERAGCEALVVTLDLPAGGKRERDLRNGISLPLRIGVRHVVEGITHPVWALQMMRAGLLEFENVRGFMGDDSAGLTIAAKVGASLDATFDWDDLAKLRDLWPRTLIVKGVEHPGDARRLLELGVDAIWISNHGGRQLDGAVASMDAAPAIAAAVGDRIPLLLDSGVRRGIDAIKARAVGVRAVAVGRAALFGAAAGGEAGARRALEILISELALSMKLAGIASMDAIDARVLSATTSR